MAIMVRGGGGVRDKVIFEMRAPCLNFFLFQAARVRIKVKEGRPSGGGDPKQRFTEKTKDDDEEYLDVLFADGFPTESLPMCPSCRAHIELLRELIRGFRITEIPTRVSDYLSTIQR